MSFRHLKVGDEVDRVFGNGIHFMRMKIMFVEDDLIYCAHKSKTEHWPKEELWRFHRDFGCEEDPDLGWGVKFRRTGSQLKLVEGD